MVSESSCSRGLCTPSNAAVIFNTVAKLTDIALGSELNCPCDQRKWHLEGVKKVSEAAGTRQVIPEVKNNRPAQGGLPCHSICFGGYFTETLFGMPQPVLCQYGLMVTSRALLPSRPHGTKICCSKSLAGPPLYHVSCGSLFHRTSWITDFNLFREIEGWLCSCSS